jgi:hypothetical protein
MWDDHPNSFHIFDGGVMNTDFPFIVFLHDPIVLSKFRFFKIPSQNPQLQTPL